MFTPQQLFEIHGYYEEDRCIIVENKYTYHVYCPHLEPLDFTINMVNVPKTSQQNNKIVDLNQYRIGSGQSIFTGKCEVCGKVYYRY